MIYPLGKDNKGVYIASFDFAKGHRESLKLLIVLFEKLGVKEIRIGNHIVRKGEGSGEQTLNVYDANTDEALGTPVQEVLAALYDIGQNAVLLPAILKQLITLKGALKDQPILLSVLWRKYLNATPETRGTIITEQNIDFINMVSQINKAVKAYDAAPAEGKAAAAHDIQRALTAIGTAATDKYDKTVLDKAEERVKTEAELTTLQEAVKTFKTASNARDKATAIANIQGARIKLLLSSLELIPEQIAVQAEAEKIVKDYTVANDRAENIKEIKITVQQNLLNIRKNPKYGNNLKLEALRHYLAEGEKLVRFSINGQKYTVIAGKPNEDGECHFTSKGPKGEDWQDYYIEYNKTDKTWAVKETVVGIDPTIDETAVVLLATPKPAAKKDAPASDKGATQPAAGEVSAEGFLAELGATDTDKDGDVDLADIDTDKDGKISGDEANTVGVKGKELFTAIDNDMKAHGTNGDGYLTLVELKEFYRVASKFAKITGRNLNETLRLYQECTLSNVDLDSLETARGDIAKAISTQLGAEILKKEAGADLLRKLGYSSALVDSVLAQIDGEPTPEKLAAIIMNLVLGSRSKEETQTGLWGIKKPLSTPFPADAPLDSESIIEFLKTGEVKAKEEPAGTKKAGGTKNAQKIQDEITAIPVEVGTDRLESLKDRVDKLQSYETMIANVKNDSHKTILRRLVEEKKKSLASEFMKNTDLPVKVLGLRIIRSLWAANPTNGELRSGHIALIENLISNQPEESKGPGTSELREELTSALGEKGILSNPKNIETAQMRVRVVLFIAKANVSSEKTPTDAQKYIDDNLGTLWDANFWKDNEGKKALFALEVTKAKADLFIKQEKRKPFTISEGVSIDKELGIIADSWDSKIKVKEKEDQEFQNVIKMMLLGLKQKLATGKTPLEIEDATSAYIVSRLFNEQGKTIEGKEKVPAVFEANKTIAAENYDELFKDNGKKDNKERGGATKPTKLKPTPKPAAPPNKVPSSAKQPPKGPTSANNSNKATGTPPNEGDTKSGKIFLSGKWTKIE